MPIDFSPLQQIDPAGAFLQGRERAQAQAERNALRQMQMQQMAMQQENLLAQRQEREAHAAQRKAELDRAAESESWLGKMSALFGANKVPLTLDTAREAQLYAVRSRDKNAIDMMNKTVAALEEREALRSAFGPQAAAPAATPAAAPSMMRQAPGAAPAAPINMFAGTMADIGTMQPAPVNALVAPPQAPTAAPAAPAAGGMSRERLQAIIADPNAPKAVVDRAKALLTTLPKEPGVPTHIQEFEAFQKMTPAQQASYLTFREKQTPKTTVSVGVSTEKKYGEQFAGNVAKADEALWSAAQDAPFAAENANRILSTLASGKAITGPLADVKLNIARALNVAGADNAEMISKTEALVTSMAENTLNAIKTSGLGTGQGFTDKDLKFLQEAKSGNINFQPDTIRQLAELAHRAAEKTAEKWSGRVKQIPKSALEGTGVSTEPITVPKRASSVTATARPSGVGPDWTLMRDANGRKAWVSPDGKQHKEVQ